MKKSIILLFITTVIFFNINKKNSETIVVPEKSIRFRIIANSNSSTDQNLKEIIKQDIVKNYITKLDSNTYNNMENNIINTQDALTNILDKYNVKYDISYDNNYFPPKTYKGIKYEEGNYQSLVIKLGEASGNNWWCILFPPLCMLENDSKDYDEVEYKSYFKELISKS